MCEKSDDEEATKASFAFAELLKSIDTSTLSTRDRIILEESIKVFESDFYGSARLLNEWEAYNKFGLSEEE